MVSALARKTPLIPPADVPDTMSTMKRVRISASGSYSAVGGVPLASSV
jgi:hypothetical protein